MKSLNREDQLLAVNLESGQEYCASAIVVASGSEYRRLGVPGEEDFIGAGVHFCATCDGPFYKDQDVIVVGGGNSGFQEGLYLKRFAKTVTILEIDSEVRASLALQQKVADQEGMEVMTRTTVEEFRGTEHLDVVVVRNLATNSTREMHPGAVFVFIGLDPNTRFLRGTLKLDEQGFIVTGSNLETNIPGVFAAGDCRAGSTKQIASAVGEGATAALLAREFLQRQGEKGPAVMS